MTRADKNRLRTSGTVVRHRSNPVLGDGVVVGYRTRDWERRKTDKRVRVRWDGLSIWCRMQELELGVKP